MIILFDADDTVENLLETWLDYLNERHGTHVTPADCTDWDVSLAFPSLTREQVYDEPDWDELWRRVQPLPGCQAILQRLHDEGHELYLVTATDYQSVPTKVEVLLEMFPFLDWKHIIITSHKQLIRGDVLIDDGPHNLVGGRYEKILFHCVHNRDFDEKAHGIHRAHGWEEVYQILSTMKTAAGSC